MSSTEDRAEDAAPERTPGPSAPATPPVGGFIIHSTHTTLGDIHTNLAGDMQVAGRDASAGGRDRGARPDWSSWSLAQRLASVAGAFAISVVAGFFVYFWTVDEGAEPSEGTAPSETTTTGVTTDDPETTTTTARTGAPARQGVVHGCNTYGENCEGNPIYERVPPPPDYDWAVWPTVAKVPNGSTLTARCWALGAITRNYAETDHGPDPYASDVYFNVQAPDGRWGWIPDTYFVRDEAGRMGLPKCSDTVGG